MDTKWKTNEETALDEMYKTDKREKRSKKEWKEKRQKEALKKSKKIKAFIYRVLAAGAFFTMVCSGIMGREALNNLNRMGEGALTGDIYYLTDFREYIATICLEAMTGYARVGDDNGFPLTGDYAYALSLKNMEEFEASIKYAEGDILYHIDDKGQQIDSSGIPYPLFSEYDGHLLLPEDVTLCFYWDGPGNTLNFFGREYSLDFPVHIFSEYTSLQYRPNMEEASDIRLLLAVRDADSFTSYTLHRFQKQAKDYQQVLFIFLGSMTVFLVSGVLCLLSRRSAKQMWQDFAAYSLKLWMECKLLLLAGSIFLCYIFCLWDFAYPTSYRTSFYSYLWLYMPTGILIYLFFKDWRFNGANAWKHSLIGSIIRFVKDYAGGMKWYRKALLLFLTALTGSLLLLALSIFPLYFALYFSVHPISLTAGLAFLFLFLMGLLLLFASLQLKKFVKDANTLSTRLSSLRDGSAHPSAALTRHSLLSQAEEDLNALEEGIEAAVEQQNRSNRMRVELITNVSHDLKTPLTSIINYADLLCEENLPAPASEYASALQAKAYRLKGMVQDVFELSKATSGNLPVEKTVLDLAKLIKQTLADMDERILDSTLTFKLSISTEPVMIEADGEKLYRIFQNLIVNALQYSLEHSRVHIQLTTENGFAYAKVKNTSREELNFDASEIVERFVRADSSRTTEGSGLGLSIVQSFTEACGGSFHITTDADMFTACVSFPLAESPAAAPLNPQQKTAGESVCR